MCQAKHSCRQVRTSSNRAGLPSFISSGLQISSSVVKNSPHPHPHKCVGSIYIGRSEPLDLVVSCTHPPGLARSWLCQASSSDPRAVRGEAGAACKPLRKRGLGEGSRWCGEFQPAWSEFPVGSNSSGQSCPLRFPSFKSKTKQNKQSYVWELLVSTGSWRALVTHIHLLCLI